MCFDTRSMLDVLTIVVLMLECWISITRDCIFIRNHVQMQVAWNGQELKYCIARNRSGKAAEAAEEEAESLQERRSRTTVSATRALLLGTCMEAGRNTLRAKRRVRAWECRKYWFVGGNAVGPANKLVNKPSGGLPTNQSHLFCSVRKQKSSQNEKQTIVTRRDCR